MIILPGQLLMSFQTVHSCSWRTLLASKLYVCAGSEHEIDDVLSGGVRTVPASPTEVVADPVFGQSGQRVIERLDANLQITVVFVLVGAGRIMSK
jgi:hypothetical protein